MWIEDPANFCRRIAGVSGAEVYWKSTGVSGLGKSAAKEWAMAPALLVPPAVPVQAVEVRVALA